MYNRHFFHFNQSHYQNDGGWCIALSYAILTNIIECNIRSHIVSPEDAYSSTKTYVSLFSKTFDPIQRKATMFSPQLRKTLESIQHSRLSQGAVGQRMRGLSSGGGYGILGLHVDVYNKLPCQYPPGYFFNNWRYRLFPDVNHAGVVVWSSFQIFIFDPNCGGALYIEQRPTVESLDSCLKDMHAKKGGGVCSQVVDITNPISLPFGYI